AAWPQLLQTWRDWQRDDAKAAETLRLRLVGLRPQASELAQQPVEPPPETPVNTASSDEAAAQRREQARTALAAARRAERELRWYGDDGALRLYANAGALDEDLDGVRDGLARLIDRILIDAREALQRRRDAAPAQAAVAALASLPAAATAHAELQRLLTLAERRSAGADRVQRIAGALSQADRTLRKSRPTQDELLQLGEQLAQAQQLDPGDTRMRDAVDRLVAILLLRAGEQIDRDDRNAAEALLTAARQLAPNSAQLQELQVRIDTPAGQGP
ncbi:MAG: hypothetical protein KDI48_04115, partial [Xanthomonadales bacterium]|nr:hypothetical protein [Xanthomonadales bacterium]